MKSLGICDMSFVIVPVCYKTQNFIEIELISLKYGDMTIFKMTVVRHFEFSKFHILWHLTVITVGKFEF